jgi:type I restriction enzyme S subunit
VAHVQRGFVTSEDPRYLELTEVERETRLLAYGDVLVVEGHANSMEIGRAAMFQGLDEPTTYQTHLFRVRPDVDQLLPKFLLYVLNSEQVQRHWNAICNTSSGLNTINRRNPRNLLIQFPDTTEQRKILEALETGESSVSASEQKLFALQRVKKSLLQNLLTGNIRLPPDTSIPNH